MRMTRLILTIDDAPSSRFAEVLDYLVSRDLGAVIFIKGGSIEGHEQELIRAIKEGFVIGNHSYSHPHFDKIGVETAKNEITRTDKIIHDLYLSAGVKNYAKYFRFPYGVGGTPETEKEYQETLAKLGYLAPRFAPKRDWYWDVPLLEDWHLEDSDLQTKEEIAQRYLSDSKKGLASKGAAVVVVHDKEPNVQQGLFRWIIEEAERQGFSFYNRNELREKLIQDAQQCNSTVMHHRIIRKDMMHMPSGARQKSKN